LLYIKCKNPEIQGFLKQTKTVSNHTESSSTNYLPWNISHLD